MQLMSFDRKLNGSFSVRCELQQDYCKKSAWILHITIMDRSNTVCDRVYGDILT